jgi:hypothetical protein
MRRAILTTLTIYFGWREFSDDLAYWLPAWGTAFDSGCAVWGQVFLLGALSLIIVGVVVLYSRDLLDWIFD